MEEIAISNSNRSASQQGNRLTSMSRWQSWQQCTDLASQKQADSYSREGGMCRWCRQHSEVILPWLQFEWLVRSKPFTYTLSHQTLTHLYFPFSHQCFPASHVCQLFSSIDYCESWGKLGTNDSSGGSWCVASTLVQRLGASVIWQEEFQLSSHSNDLACFYHPQC